MLCYFCSSLQRYFIGELKQSVEGISKACEFLNIPVVSGNVSLYNKNNFTNISPTPMVGMLGKIADTTKAVPATITHDSYVYLLENNITFCS